MPSRRFAFLLVPALAGCPVGADAPDDTAGADDTAAACTPAPRPLLTTEQTLVDFGALGMANAGYTVSGLVEIHNEGDAPLGVTLALGEGRPDFAIADDGVGPTHEDACATSTTVDAATVYVLPPGCEQVVVVSYSPVDPWGAADALVVASAPDDPDGAWLGDPAHAARVVWLEGRSTGEWGGGASYVAGGVVAFGETALHEGDTTTAAVRVFGPDAETATVTWSTDAAEPPFAPSSGASVTYTAPAVDPPGRNDNVYVVVSDDDGQDWAFGRVAVYDAAEVIGPCE